MGELAAEDCADEDKSAKAAVIEVIDANFPKDWREWPVYKFTFEDLFGAEQISPAIESKIRFALPTVDLAKAFNPSASSLSERHYKIIRTTLLNWAIGRALLYAPHNLMEKIHAPAYHIFMETVAKLKASFIKRREASHELAEGNPTSRKRPGMDPLSDLSPHPKRFASTPQVPTPERASSVLGSSEHLLATVLSQQMALLNKMMATQTEQGEQIKGLLNSPLAVSNPRESEADRSYESVPDSTEGENEDVEELSKEDQLRSTIADAQRQLAELQGDSSNEAEFDFTPCTTSQDPKIAKAGDMALKHGIQCQKFRDQDWRSIRYGETQKLFQATPAFTALKTNNLLVGLTPDWKSNKVLERFDLTLGAISHGLIQQRMIFQDLLASLPKEVKRAVGKEFVAADSKFRKTSDALLQYVCGRRAEVLQHRREVYKPKKALRDILDDIPPSETHLFEESAFSAAVKEQGGVHKFFPDKRRTPKPAVPKSNSKQRPSNYNRDNRDNRPAKRTNYLPKKEGDRAPQRPPTTNAVPRGKKWGGKVLK